MVHPPVLPRQCRAGLLPTCLLKAKAADRRRWSSFPSLHTRPKGAVRSELVHGEHRGRCWQLFVHCQLQRIGWHPGSLFRALLHGKAALGRFSIAWFEGPMAWPPIHLMHAASGSGVVLCCFGLVLVHNERADPCTEQLAARL